MDALSFIGNIASIVGLVVAFYTLYKVEKLPATLKQQSRDKQLSDAIDKIIKISAGRSTLVDSTSRNIEAIAKTVRLYYVSKLPFRQGKLKSLLAALDNEIAGQKQLSVVQLQLGLIRDEITIR